MTRRKLFDALEFGRSLQPTHDLQTLEGGDVSSDDITYVLDVSELEADAQPKKVTVGSLTAGASDPIARASGNAALVDLANTNFTQELSHTASSLANGASSDFTVAAGYLSNLVQVTSSHPAWIRIYSSDAARTSDNRTTPGSPFPSNGSGFYAEFETDGTPQTINTSPVPILRGSGNVVFVRKRNDSGGPVDLVTDFTVITLVSGQS
jgi:hypothetical protein